MKEQLINFITEGKMRDALEWLQTNQRGKPAIQNEINAQLGRLGDVERNRRLGVISNDELELKENRLRIAVLELIDIVFKADADRTERIETSNDPEGSSSRGIEVNIGHADNVNFY